MKKISSWVLVVVACLSITGCAFTQEAQIERNGELTTKWNKKVKVLAPMGTPKDQLIKTLEHKGYHITELNHSLLATKNLWGGHILSVSFEFDNNNNLIDSLTQVGSSSHL